MQERRLYPRYQFTLPVGVHGPDGYRASVQSCEISVSGLGLAMSRAAVTALAQGGTVLTPGDRLWVSLPGVPDSAVDDVPAVAAGRGLACRAVLVRRLALDQYIAAVAFVAPDAAQQRAIAELVEQASQTHLQP
ncbi:MAG: PilZ domain-containing protein [Sedimenticolaceae bacterium]